MAQPCCQSASPADDVGKEETWKAGEELQARNQKVESEVEASVSTSEGIVSSPHEPDNNKVEIEESTSDSPSESAASPPSPSSIPAPKLFEVGPSPKGGYGVFATQDIPAWNTIHTEAPLLHNGGGWDDIKRAVDSLWEDQEREYMSLACWDKVDTNKVACIFRTNGFQLGRQGRIGIFLKASRFNHACIQYRNCSFVWSEVDQRMIFFSNKPIAKGTEITICYNPSSAALYPNYGFFCDCHFCPVPTEAEKREEIERVEGRYQAMLKEDEKSLKEKYP